MLQEYATDDGIIEAIGKCKLELPDSKYSPVKGVFLRPYGGNKKEKSLVAVSPVFSGPRANSRELLEQVGRNKELVG